MAFDPQDYDVKPIGAAGLTERTVLDGSERILVQSGPDEDVDITPMEFVKYSTIQAKIDALILLRENLSNKKSTLSENSEVYYPNQKAVNDALNAIKGVDYTDGTLKTHEDGLATLNSRVNQSLTTSSSPTFAGLTVGTINTGQGATEVHLMNQNLRKSDSPTFAGLTLGDLEAYACRAWVNFNGSAGGGAGGGTNRVIRGSGNVSSVEYLDTGSYKIHFITAMPDINYSVACSSRTDIDPTCELAYSLRVKSGVNMLTTSVTVIHGYSYDINGGTNQLNQPRNATHAFVEIFR